MTDLQYGAGWGASVANMSPNLRARIEAHDREEQRQAAAEARERAELAEELQMRNIRSAVELAVQRGEVVNMGEVWRTNGACLGRTHGEAIAYFSAVQDMEDRRHARQAAKEIAAIGADRWYGEMSGDTSAPHPDDVAEQAAIAGRAAEIRHLDSKIARQVRGALRYARRFGGAR
jgi:hypothetical protein